jgi:capsular exopolysaccharide synthesis family protein
VSNTLLSITDRLIETKERLKKSEDTLIDFVKNNNFGVENGDENGSHLSSMKSILVEKKAELVSLRSKYGEKHPLVIAKEREISGMEKLFEEERKKLLNEKEKEIKFSMLQRDAEVEKEIYNTLLREMKKIDVMSNIKDMDIKLIEEASLPLHPVKPRPFRSCLFGAFAGFMIGIIAIFIMENLDTTIKRESEIEENYNLPILASIPHIKFQEFSEVLNWKSGIYEKFYSILTLSGFISPNPKTFLIVSGGIGEGKTFISLLFSASLASGGNKVLLVDMDFKGHRLKELLKVKNNYGLSNCLLGEISTKDAISGTDIKNLYLLPAGENPPISPSLLLKKKFQELHGELRESYDYIVIDTPPILLYSHPLEILNSIDFILLIVRSHHSTKQDLKRVISMLREVKAKAAGAVFNYAEERRYYYRYYYPS